MELPSPVEDCVWDGDRLRHFHINGPLMKKSSSEPRTLDQVHDKLKHPKHDMCVYYVGLISMGLSPGVHSMVGIYSKNCPEWVIAEQGVYSYSMVLVPLYDSLGPDARSYVLSQCEMR